METEENYHIYTMDGETFSKAKSIVEIPAEAGYELYVDTIPIELTDEFVELLRRGVRIFNLRRITIVAKRRVELKLPKNSRNDLKAMMSLDSMWFIEVDEDFLVIRRLCAVFRSLFKTRTSLLKRAKALKEDDREGLMISVRTIEESMKRVATKIVYEAERRLPFHNRLVEALGISGEKLLFAREALAEILLHINRSNHISGLEDSSDSSGVGRNSTMER
ncbi:MAG: hypothetical protein QXM16_01685 [Nitrososphaerota archaeon]